MQDLLKLTETLQHEKSRLQIREQKDAADTLKLQQALTELRAAHSMVKVSFEGPGLMSIYVFQRFIATLAVTAGQPPPTEQAVQLWLDCTHGRLDVGWDEG